MNPSDPPIHIWPSRCHQQVHLARGLAWPPLSPMAAYGGSHNQEATWCAGLCLNRLVLCGVMILASAKSFECHIGSFVQVHIESLFGDLVRIDLQAALQRSIHTLHLPGRALQDDLVKMHIFVPQGVTCFSGATFECTSSFENWQAVLMAEGRRVFPGRNPDTMIFHREQ